MFVRNGGTIRRLLVLLVALALQVCAATWVEAQTALPEGIPDFSQDSTRTHVQTAQSGDWSSPSTWVGGVVPNSNQVVRILQAHIVTITDQNAAAYTVSVDGQLAFAPTVNTALYVTNLQVMAGDMGMGTPGVLELGTVANPIASNVTAQITIANNPLGGSVPDVDQFGTGITVLGKLSMHGSVRTPTFVRLATEPHQGHTTLTLSEPVSGWQPGDRLILPDTRHMKTTEVDAALGGRGWVNKINQWEELTVQSISPDGRTVNLALPLLYDHLGARDFNNVLEFLPHVGNLTRNVIVRSENPNGTRGHMLSIHVADVDIRYALFKDLGRTTYLPLNATTNHIGRYPIHMHHLSGPASTPLNGYQFTLLGNAVDGGSVETKFKWGITVHGTHYGSIKDNVVYNYNGAAIATEDGSESFNEFDHNFAVRGMGEPDEPGVQARMAMGTEGVGFWFRGPNNFVRNNVAANFQNPTTEAAYGFVFQFLGLGNIAIPNFKGAHEMVPGTPGLFTIKDGNSLPLLQFDNNEAYGAMQGGLTYWWISSQDPVPSPNPQESVIRNFKAWHIYNKTVYVYPGQKVTIDGLKIRGKFDAASQCCGDGVWFEDYSTKDTIIRNADIQGMEDGIQAPSSGFGPGPNLVVENSYLRNWRNINVPTPSSVNGCWMEDKLVTVINTRFEAAPGRPLSNINMVGKANGVECLARLDEVRVYAYNGDASENFQVYHPSSAVLPRPPAGCATSVVPGIGGLLNPSTFVSAPTCPIAPIVTTGSIASPAPGSTLTSDTQLFQWSTGVGVTSYQLSVGTFEGGSDIYLGGPVTATSALVTGLPTHGGVIWARLSSSIDGAWQYVDTSYTAVGVPLFIDLAPSNMVSVQGNEAQTTPAFNAAKGDLLLAFVSSSGPDAPGMTMTVTGSGGLAWTLVKRANNQNGVAEIWKATALADLTGITVTSTPTQPTPSQSLVVITFAGTGGVGASAAASGPVGGPSVSLTATKTGSFVYGVGNDWNGSVSRTVGTNQTVVHEFLGPNGDTFWVQRLNGTVPLIGTLITLNDSAPINDSWNFVAVEIIPMQRVPPPITWPTPADIVYGTPLDDTQLNATTEVAGTFVYTPPPGTVLSAGANQTLSVTFTPANNTTIYGPATASVSVNVTKAPSFVTWFNPADISYGTALGAAQLNATANLPGAFVYSPAAGAILSAGNNQPLSVTFTPDDPNYQTVVSTVFVNVTATTPVVIWNVPAPIIYGTALSAGQLNASAGVPGSFVYSPAAGTVLGAGSRTLTVTFTPTDTAYTPSVKTVPLTVLKATPVVTWSTPANIVSGTALSATQLNAAVASPAGTLVYSPAAGTVLGAGPAQRLTVTFTPNDTANYNVVTAAVPITVISAAVGATPAKIGTTIAGTFNDATGHSGQSHLVYAPNAGVWWLFTLSSAHDALGDRTVQTYVSSGADLATATWTAKNVSPTLGNMNGATSSVLAGGRSLGVAVRSIAGVDYAHVFVSSAFDGQTSSNGHARATVGATSITWGAWNNPGSPNTASEWQGPLNSGNPPSAAASHTSWGNSIGISTGGFIHHYSVTMDQEVDCAVGRSANADTAATWTNGFGSNVSPTGQAGTSPPWTTAVIDKTMTNECKAMSFAPLASNVMLAVYTNGAVAQPNITNLRYMRSNAVNNGTWTNISASTGGGDGNVFSSTANINQNDWALVPVNTTTVYAFRRKAAGTGIDAATYNAAANSWSAFSAPPPTFASGQAFKPGGGLFGVTDGTNVWLFVINTDTANSILYTQFNGTSWTAWATVPGTGVGSQTRGFIAGNPTIGSGQAGLAWTQTNGSNFDVYATSFRTATAAAPSTVSLTAPASGSGVAATVNVSADATPGSGTIAGVQFLLDGVNLGAEDTSSPYSVVWDTTSATNGTHFLTAIARDTSGGTGTATTVAVTVANDLASPTVVMTAPANGASVSGAIVSVSAEALDDIGVSGVQFLIDGAPLGAEDTSAPYIVNWNASASSAGTHLLSARARDAAGRQTTSATISVTVSSATPSVTWAPPASIVYGTALGSTQLNASASVPGTFAYNPPAGTVLNAGASQTLSVIFTPTDTTSYSTATASVTITVTKATPSITWPTPASIVYGTVLSATQLNAAAGVAGTFSYTPVAGTVLAAGAGQTLSVTFTPADTTNYATATANVAITVTKATPAITWPTPAAIVYGTTLSATQLNATTSVPGTFAYTPDAGAVLAAGSGNVLSTTFTPTDPANYTTATASVTINVTKATPAITWNTPANIVYGTALSATQLNAATSVPGTFVYTPAAGTVLSAGAGQTLSATFTPTDPTNYTTATASTTLTVLQATPTISWTPPANLVYGTALSATQLNATASVPGTFVYTPAAGAELGAGPHTLSVTFTATDALNYTTATASVALTVLQATPTITWATPANLAYGTALSATQLNATGSVPGTFLYTPAAGAELGAGPHTLSVTFTPTDAVNYTTATASTPLTVLQATPTITWTPPANLVYGTALGATQLNATASVPGTFVYTPAAGAELGAGPRTLSVTFTPTDAVNYTTATASTPLTVLQATPTITWTPPAGIVYGTALSATQLNATGSVPGTFVYTPAAGVELGAGPRTLSVTFTPADAANYADATANVPLTVTPAVPALTLTGGHFEYDTLPHAATGTATGIGGVAVAGSFALTYAPGGSTAPVNAGTYSVTAAFTSTDPNYSGGNAAVTVTIDQATIDASWATPADIVYETPLGPAQLNALANIPGDYVYTPPAGTVLPAGTGHVLSMTFTPSDPNYRAYTETVSINVLKATPVVTWAAPASIGYGTALSATELHATANVAGTFTYSPAAGDVLSAGAHSLSVTFTPTDANFDAATKSVALTVLQATPAIVWSAPANIIYGTALGSAELAATSGVSGTFAFSPAAGTVLAAGAAQSLSVTFTPTDATNYSTATASVLITVLKATPAIALSGGPFDYDAVAHPATGIATGVGGTPVDGTFGFTYTPGGSVPPVNAATYSVAAVFTSSDPNYSSNSSTSTLTINRAVPHNVWATPTDIAYGTPLGASQLNMVADAAGTYFYMPPTGTVLSVKDGHVLFVTFTPTDPNYLPFTKTVSINVVKAAPVITWNTPAQILVGTGLSAAQLNATASVPGTFAYSPASGTVLPSGDRTLSVTFTPTDAVNYALATKSVTLHVKGLPSVTVSATNVPPLGTVTATVADGPDNASDWVALYAVGGSAELEWKFLNGLKTAPATGVTTPVVLPFTLPAAAGTYVLRYYANNTYTVLATSAPMTVAGLSFSISSTTAVTGGPVTATVANGPATPADWVGLYPVGASTLVDWKYLNGSRTIPAAGLGNAVVPFTMPPTAGSYVLKFFANNSSTAMATSAPIVVTSATLGFTVSATTTAPGNVVTATVVNGPGNATDWIALFAENGSTWLDWKFLNGTRVAPAAGIANATVSFTMPTTPGNYTLRLYANDTWTILAISPTITVGGVTFSVSATDVAPASTITATIANGPANAKDWVALYAVGGNAELDWKFLNGSRVAPTTGVSNATVSFTLPTTAGAYVLRFYSNNTYTILATSPTITVGSRTVTLTLSATSVAPGGIVSATIAGGPANAKDWVALYTAGGTSELDWKFLNGLKTAPAAGTADATVSFTMPTTPGTYVLRFYSNDTYTLLASSGPITVTAPGTLTFSVSATTVTGGATVTTTVANGPANATDWVGVYSVGGSTELDWMFLNGSKIAPATGIANASIPVTFPSMPGPYVLKLYTNNTHTVLATSPTVTVQ